ncbi:hypothetical protein GOQ27_11965 [Clostridium sp. D2Q-11]|uniref:Uncharacterized protein n=1 Tax=Anaeromonas frigoriresistens TaxID=2683708 RepID=A0A942Z7X5_9FIRM|nr:hypothetical protein [Anaeromonas frigoriresistens]MBS4539182.1 hypothetical protein [Anaeromonas frigoriresistens]
MKRLKSIFLAVTLIISIFSGNLIVYAEVDNTKGPENHKNSYSINEYEMLKNMTFEKGTIDIEDNNEIPDTTEVSKNRDNKKMEKEMKELSKKLSKEDLIKEYKDKIYSLKEWKVKELKSVGYTDKQIDAIKNFDGSEEMMIAAATTVDVNIGLRNINSSYQGTTVDVIADFNSQGIQSNWFMDIFAVTWSSPLTVVSNTGTVRYVNSNGNSKYYTHTPVPADSLYARQMKFYKYKDEGYPAYYVHSGSMIIKLKSNTKVYDIAAYAAYGYNSISVNPYVSVKGDVGLSFSTGVSNVGWDYTSN